MKIANLAAALLLGAVLTAPAPAHEGEAHGAPEAAQRLGDDAPRAASATEEFELVVVLTGTQLLVHVDRYLTNEAVAGARIEVESGAFKAEAKELSPGVYAVDAVALARPGAHPLTFSIETADTADLISATLVVDAPAARPELAQAGGGGPGGRAAAWGGAAAILLVAAGWVGARARRRTREGAGR